jgi:hypothetical protein
MPIQFITRNVHTDVGICKEVCLLSERLEVLCHLAAWEDDKAAWLGGFVKMLEAPGTVERLRCLIPAAAGISDCGYDEGDRSTFLRVVDALLDFLQPDKSQKLAGHPDVCDAVRGFLESVDGYPQACEAIRRFLERQFEFRATYGDSGYAYRILVNGEPFLNKRYPLDLLLDRVAPSCIPQGLWASAILEMRDRDANRLRQAVLDHEFLYEAALRQADLLAPPDRLFVLRSFASFSKSLVEFLEQDQHYADLRRVIPSICAVIVKNEYESLDEQKHYLERILRSREHAIVQLQRLYDIVYDVEQDSPPGTSSSNSRLPTIVSLISDHFLDNYDLDQAVAFWEGLAGTDHLLSFLVRLYKRPRQSLVAGITLFLVLALLAHLNVSNYTWVGPWRSWIPYLALVPLGAVYLGAVWLTGYIAYRLWWKRDLYYAQLFLPRLLGAIIVGLSVLLLDDLPWKIATRSQPLNFLLICLGVYLLSFVYIFINVYQTVKFLPSLPVLTQANSQPIPSTRMSRWPKLFSIVRGRGPSLEPKVSQSAVQRAVMIGWQVYAIGVLGSFLAVLLTTTLMYPATGLNLEPDLIGRIVLPSNLWGTFAFFPALVLLWTGLALFIGAFVQLIWQDRRITSPA